MELNHLYGVYGHRYSKAGFMDTFSHVCFAGLQMPNLKHFHLICDSPLGKTHVMYKEYTHMAWAFLRDVETAFDSPEFMVFKGGGKKQEWPYIVQFSPKPKPDNRSFRDWFLIPGTLFRYVTEHPSVVISYHQLRAAGMPRDLALVLSVSSHAQRPEDDSLVTCKGGRGMGHSLRLAKIQYLDSAFSLKKARQTQLANGGKGGELAVHYMPDGCLLTHNVMYTTGIKQVLGRLTIDEKFVKSKLADKKRVLNAGKGKQRAPKDLFDVNYVLDDA